MERISESSNGDKKRKGENSDKENNEKKQVYDKGKARVILSEKIGESSKPKDAGSNTERFFGQLELDPRRKEASRALEEKYGKVLKESRKNLKDQLNILTNKNISNIQEDIANKDYLIRLQPGDSPEKSALLVQKSELEAQIGNLVNIRDGNEKI